MCAIGQHVLKLYRTVLCGQSHLRDAGRPFRVGDLARGKTHTPGCGVEGGLL